MENSLGTIPKPKAVIKLIEENKSGLSDSGLADSRNVTFSPQPNIIEFSPLVISNKGKSDESVAVPEGCDTDSDAPLEITTDEGPFQSSGLAEAQLNIPDVSTINLGIRFELV